MVSEERLCLRAEGVLVKSKTQETNLKTLEGSSQKAMLFMQESLQHARALSGRQSLRLGPFLSII